MVYLRKLLIILILSFCVFLWRPPITLALSAELTIDTNQLETGGITQMRITVQGSSAASRPEISQQPGVIIKYMGPFTQLKFVNGESTAQITYNYSVQASKSGTYQLGPYTLSCGGEELTTNSLELMVTDHPRLGDNGASEKKELKDLFLELVVPKTQLYLGESLPVQIRLYVGNVSVHNLTYPTIPNQGEVIISEATKPTEQRRIINGVPYEILTFTRTLTPVKTGNFTLGPAELSCSIIKDQISNDPFFNLFEQYEKRSVALKTEPLTIRVLPLPKEEQPADFSGGIGRFHLKITASPLTVKAGDPLTLQITITGEGDLTSVRPPCLPEDDKFKVYDPQRIDKPNTDSSSQVIHYEQVVIPLNTEVKAIPALSLSYFDPETKEYRRVETNPLPLTVTPNPDLQGRKDPEEFLGRDLVYIKDEPGNLRRQGTEVYRSFWFWGWQLILVLLFGFALGYRRRQEVLTSNTVEGRSLRAHKAAEKEMDNIRKMLAKDDPQNLLSSLHRILREYIGMKFGLSPAGITGQVCTELKALDVSEEILEEIKDFFACYDFYQFTATTIDQEKAEALWWKTQRIIKGLADMDRTHVSKRRPPVINRTDIRTCAGKRRITNGQRGGGNNERR